MKAPKPNDLVRDALRYLRAVRRFPAWRNNTGGMRRGDRFVWFGERGAPDILGILPGGRLLGVEAKTGGGKLTPCQAAWHANANSAGALVLVIGSLQELREKLAEAGYPEGD